MPKGRSGGFVQDSISTSLFSTTVGDRWSPLQPYSTSALRFPSPPSVDFVDSSPLWEPYMPLLEERCPKGGVVVSYRTAPRRHFSALPRATNGRPYDSITPLLSVFSCHPSVDFVDSSPLWEPYMPLLEKRCPKGGVVASYRTMTSTSIFLHPSVNFVDSSPRWEPYMPLLEERCPKGGVVASYKTASRRHFSALPRATNGRPYDSIPLSQNSKKRSQ